MVYIGSSPGVAKWAIMLPLLHINGTKINRACLEDNETQGIVAGNVSPTKG